MKAAASVAAIAASFAPDPDAETLALVTSEELDKPYDPPGHVRRAYLKGRWKARDECERLALALRYMHPRGIVPSRLEIAALISTVLSCVDEDMTRAGDAAEKLLRRGFTIPRDTILACRQADADRRTTTAREETPPWLTK